MAEHTFMVVVAVAIGALGGLGAVAFRFLIKVVQRAAWGSWTYDLGLVASHPWWWRFLTPAIGGLIIGPLVYYLAREAKGHGVPEVMEAVALRSGFIRSRLVAIKSVASAICIGTGGSVGREGPIVQIGAALGSTIGQWLRISGRRLRTLAGCGAAAGIAATFNAPVAGALFAVEIILGDFGVSQFSPIVISSVMATVVSRHFLGDFPAFVVPTYTMESAWELPLYLLLGLLAAVAAQVFIRVLYGIEDLMESLPVKPWLLPALGGLMVGAIGLLFPQVLGVGFVKPAQQMLEQFVQDLQLFLQRFRRAGGKAAVVGFDAGGVKADLAEANQVVALTLFQHELLEIAGRLKPGIRPQRELARRGLEAARRDLHVFAP